jgi:hypothetical protein
MELPLLSGDQYLQAMTGFQAAHTHNPDGYSRFPRLDYGQDICWQQPECRVFHHMK